MEDVKMGSSQVLIGAAVFNFDLTPLPDVDTAFERVKLLQPDWETYSRYGEGASCWVGSVDLTRVVGTSHPDYAGLTWRDLRPKAPGETGLQHLKRAGQTMDWLRSNPTYYLEKQDKLTWSFYELNGDYYIAEGNHRTVVARYFLLANGLPPVVHGVTITSLCKMAPNRY